MTDEIEEKDLALIDRLIRERDEARAAIAKAKREALQEAAALIGSGHFVCCSPSRYDAGECCGLFIPAQAAILALIKKSEP
jgi:hypothetical protein